MRGAWTAGVRRVADALELAATAVLARRGRNVLTAVGIGIGIAAMIAVLGISASSRAHVLSRLDGLGTAYLRATTDERAGPPVLVDRHAAASLRRLPHVEAATATAALDASVRRSDLVDELETNALTVRAADPTFVTTLRATLATGRFVQDADVPEVVLGDVAARRLGIRGLGHGPLVFVADRWLAVVGVLDPMPLAADLDAAALVSWPTGESLSTEPVTPRSLWVRADTPTSLAGLRPLITATLVPDGRSGVELTRPSDLVEAWAEADSAFTALLVGLGGVALLVGGLGIANVQVIAVLERRSEIGVRRALGATRGDVRLAVLAESTMVSLLGAAVGVSIGWLVTAGYATQRSWPVAVPVLVVAGGIVAALAVGLIAGLYPASRAARLSPVDAIRPR